MNYNNFINIINSKFIYRSDKLGYGYEDYWNNIEDFKNSDIIWYGDCEDYVLYLYNHISDCEIWYCTLEGNGHVILKLPDGLWIDNNVKKPIKEFNKTYKIIRQFSKEEIENRISIAKSLPKLDIRQSFDLIGFINLIPYKIKRILS